MNYHFIKLFSLKECSKSVITQFDDFLKSKEIDKVTYLIEHGPYQSAEGRNKGYNYILKITVDGNPAKFKSDTEKEYLEFLEKLKPSFNQEKQVFSTEYEPSTQLTNQLVRPQSPINHVVFLPFKETSKTVEINKSFELLTNLFNELPGISSFTYGKCHDSSNKNYVFEMNFSDESKRDNYLTDKQHVEVAHRIIPLLENGAESIIAFDYQILMPPKKLSTLSNSSFFTLNPEDNIVQNNPAPKPALN
ncbi:Dabb family protein [Rickettsiella endosymbiont of Miltochrista miniata]|uniref:Dabb family protein n=1 Tax=Rickettsiella endosymbiont of Miltochrista miniata TaxID=3066239 RepID=UPI00313AC42D